MTIPLTEWCQALLFWRVGALKTSIPATIPRVTRKIKENNRLQFPLLSMSSPAIDLSQFDAEYRRQLNNPDATSEEVPDGRYHVNVDNVELTEAKSSGAPMLKWTLRIIGPTHANRLLWHRKVISVNAMPYVIQDLRLCRLELPSLSELPKHLGKLLDVQLEVTKRTKDGRYSVYFENRLNVPEEEDDIPF